MKNQEKTQWFEQNQKRLGETSDKEKAIALKELREYLILNLRNRTLFGAHSEEVLGVEAIDHYMQQTWEKLYYGAWEWKEGRTLAGQLKRIASCMMQKQVKKFRNMEEGKSRNDDVWGRLADVDVERLDGLTEEEDQRENAYELMLEVVKDMPEQVEYVLEVKKGGDYEAIAEAMGIEVREVRLIERRVLRRLTEFRLKGSRV